MDLKNAIREIQDYPIEGISFKDVTTLLKDKDAFKQSVELMLKESQQFDFDVVVAPEARGFLFGPIIAYEKNTGFVPVRKPGKLPSEVVRYEYELEYGTDSIEIHKDAIKPGQKVLIVDDLLATGGTTKAMINLVESLGAEVVGGLFLIELSFLDGRHVLDGYEVKSLVIY